MVRRWCNWLHRLPILQKITQIIYSRDKACLVSTSTKVCLSDHQKTIYTDVETRHALSPFSTKVCLSDHQKTKFIVTEKLFYEKMDYIYIDFNEIHTYLQKHTHYI